MALFGALTGSTGKKAARDAAATLQKSLTDATSRADEGESRAYAAYQAGREDTAENRDRSLVRTDNGYLDQREVNYRVMPEIQRTAAEYGRNASESLRTGREEATGLLTQGRD